MKISIKQGIVMGCMMGIYAGGAGAAAIHYGDFSSTAGLTLNGQAQVLNPNAGNVLRLTNSTGQSASAFSTDTVTLGQDRSFSSAFSFNMGNQVGAGDGDGVGADGLTFTMQTVSNTAGGGGGGIGYYGIANSVAVEFDTYNNGAGDGHNGNHVGINLNGSVDSVMRSNVTNRLNNGLDWFAWVDYDGSNNLFEVRLAEVNLRPATALMAYTVNLSNVLGSNLAYAGFTSGTGAGGGTHDILNWQLENTYNPITAVAPVPAPATLALTALGMVGAMRVGRQRKPTKA